MPLATTILFVDDDSTNRATLGWILRESGYRVLEAGTGGEALALTGESPDLVLLDINLPDMDGYEVCRQLRERPATRHAAIVQFSAVFVGSGDRSHGLEGGADAYLVKPVEPRELLAHIRALLRVRAAEEASRRAAQEWRSTFDAIGDAVLLVDAEGKARRCNRAAVQLLGRPFDQILDRPLAELLRESLGFDAAPPPPGQSRQERELAVGDRKFHLTADPIFDDRGVAVGAVHILNDITPHVRLEEQLRQSQRLEAVGRLAGGVAHDFNNLLTAILGNASLLMRMLPAGESEYELAATVERAAWRAAELTRQLLGFSRQTLLWLEVVEIGPVLDEVAKATIQRLSGPVRMILDYGTNLWQVQADVGHLAQVLTHLCLNALDAMPIGGTLTLAARNEEVSDPPPYADARTGQFLRLTVEDTGVGIASEVVDKIFDPFFTTKPTGKGSGLGLAMVHGIMKQHQGWVRCTSEVGKGTRFDLYLPRFRPAKEAELPGPVDGGVKRILVADDNEILRALAATYLRQAGYDVLAVADGQEAIDVFRRDSQIEVVLLDEMMPGLSGSEVFRQIRQLRPGVKGLILGAAKDGTVASLEKPYRERDLVEAVRGLFRKGEPSTTSS